MWLLAAEEKALGYYVWFHIDIHCDAAVEREIGRGGGERKGDDRREEIEGWTL